MNSLGKRGIRKSRVFVLAPWAYVISVSAHRKLVAVAQLVEPLIVIQVVAGSSPVGRPIFKPRSSESYGALPFPEGVNKISGNPKITLKNGWQSKCSVGQCTSFDTNLL